MMSTIRVVGILALLLALSSAARPAAQDRHRACREALRGGHSGHEYLTTDCSHPANASAGERERQERLTIATPEADKKAKAKVEKNRTVIKDETGSPTTKEMKDIDKAVDKVVGKHIYHLPLGVRLALVTVILALPLLVITGSVAYTPPEDRASSLLIKTLLHCGFSFAVGWLNCIMLLRYRVFATMMVGNTILMGVAFVCNGGFGTAKDEEQWLWSGKKDEEKVQGLCPAQFDDASHYMLMISLFLLGAFVQGLLQKRCGWSSRTFAPLIALGIISVELLEYLNLINDSRRVDVYLLSPIFGMFVSISAHGGVGSVPWAATGHMTSMAFKMASWFTGFNPADIRGAGVNLCLWVSFLIGIMMGSVFHTNHTVMLNAIYLQGILIIHDCVYSESAKKDDGDSDKNGIDDKTEGQPIEDTNEQM